MFKEMFLKENAEISEASDHWNSFHSSIAIKHSLKGVPSEFKNVSARFMMLSKKPFKIKEKGFYTGKLGNIYTLGFFLAGSNPFNYALEKVKDYDFLIVKQSDGYIWAGKKDLEGQWDGKFNGKMLHNKEE